MQYKKIRVLKINKDQCISKHLLFEWELENQIDKNFYSELYFKRDNEVSYFKKLENLENNYKDFYYPPFLLAIISVALAFAFLTTFFVIFMLNKDNFQNVSYSIAFLIAGGVCLLCSVLILFLRNKTAEDIITKKPKQDREFKEKIRILKDTK